MNSILLIDQSARLCGLKQFLELSGFRVLCTAANQDALKMLRQMDFELIVLSAEDHNPAIPQLCKELEVTASPTILVTITRDHELSFSRLPEGSLPAFFTRFFNDTILYLHNHKLCRVNRFAPLSKVATG